MANVVANKTDKTESLGAVFQEERVVQYVTHNNSPTLLGFASNAAEDGEHGRLRLRVIVLAMLFALPMWGALLYAGQWLLRAL
jgi:hypothetical protein